MFWLSDAEGGGVFLVLGSHVAAPCQADPSFTAYPHALAARSLGGTPQLTTSGESYRASPGACARPVRTRYCTSFCSNAFLGRPQLHSPSLACRVFLKGKTLVLQTSAAAQRSANTLT
jgi:hypothetical protein